MNYFLNSKNDMVDIEKIKSNETYKILLMHAAKFENEFDINVIKKVIRDKNDNYFGFENYYKNINEIKYLLNKFKTNEQSYLKKVKDYVSIIFPNSKFKNIIFYPSVGYDIGIGMKNIVCINFNSNIFFVNFKEIISLLIHETTHVVFERYNEPVIGIEKIASEISKKEFLDYYIHYEGLALFASYKYRKNILDYNRKNKIQNDYKGAYNKKFRLKLLNKYNSVVNDIKFNNIALQVFLNRSFGEDKLTHRLGFTLFNQIERKYNIEEVQKAALLPSKKVVKKYIHVLEEL